MTHPLRPSSTPTNDTTETWIVQEALGRVQARNPPDLNVPPTGRWRSWARRHWLGLLTTMNLLLFLGTFLSPALFALGWSDLARPAFAVYQVLCMQRPTHSFFLWGYQMSMEQRMVIIPGAQVLAGLIYALLPGRRTLRPLNAWLFVLGSLPMLVDIFSQTLGWRESDWVWRSLTGGLFGVVSIWLLYPLLAWAWASTNRTGKVKLRLDGSWHL